MRGQEYYLAIDVGASSGRHILGHVEDGRMVLEEVFRFENRQVRSGGHDCWDMDNLWEGVTDGMRRCGEMGKVPKTVGIDTWAVDFVLLDGEGARIGDAVAYRDRRTEGMDRIVDGVIPPEELYGRTGIQRQSFNTIYQLVALREERPEDLARAGAFLMIPDYLNYLLTGVRRQEYTNATSTGLLDARGKTWDRDLIGRLGLPDRLFGELSLPGEEVGPLKREIEEMVGYSARVVLPATHDTGSAFLAVPAKDDDTVFLSSGTWSLLGVESGEPITSEESRRLNFTNEGGAWYRYRYLKNIMGLWMIQSVRRELNGTAYVAGRISRHADGRQWGFQDLIEAARGAAGFPSVVDVDDDAFLAPDSMIDAVKEACARGGQPIPETVGEIMQCIYRSLAKCYARAIRDLGRVTGRKFRGIHIVGGGCQDGYLNQMTAEETGLPVYAGPVEGTAIGNLAVQMIADGAFPDLARARAAIGESFPVETFR